MGESRGAATALYGDPPVPVASVTSARRPRTGRRPQHHPDNRSAGDDCDARGADPGNNQNLENRGRPDRMGIADCSAPGHHASLRLLAVDRPAVKPRTDIVVPGALLRLNQTRAVAMVSVEEAERIVARVRAREAAFLARLGEHAMGIVLGRAAAHEIGHYLLDTATH